MEPIFIVVVLLLLFFLYREYLLTRDNMIPWSYAIKSNPYYASAYAWPSYTERGGRYTERDLTKYINRSS